MPRLATRLRAPALALVALALWLLPAATPPPGAPRTEPAAVAANAKGSALRSSASAQLTAASSGSTLSPSPGSVVYLKEAAGRSPRAYAVALDELYFPGRPASARVAAVPPRASLEDLLAHAAELAAASPAAAAPRLVLYPAGAPRNAATRRIVTPRIEATLASAGSPLPAPRPDLGIVSWERAAYAPDRALARIAGDPAQALRAAATAPSLPGVRAARPLLARRHFPKLVPNDPLFKDQWHLRNTGQQGGKRGADIRAVPAWDRATGAGVVIGIVDDGVDYTHPDLAPAYVAELGYDWNGDPPDAGPDFDPFPTALGFEDGDNHGTAVAGLALARGDNGLGVAGAAPAASLAALRLIAAATTDADDAEAMLRRNDAIYVKNNSWGPPDADLPDGYHPTLEPAGEAWAAAVETAVATGRDGRGTLVFWAAGNGQADGDQGSLDGYAGARPVIPVTTLTHRGALARFAEGGPHLVVAAPGDARIGLSTTDRPGGDGFNGSPSSYSFDYRDQPDYTRIFIGSSAATPLAAGVGALLLEARPDLGWRDVKEIFLRSSAKLQAGSRDWTTRPAGDTRHPIKHHPRLGGGALDALAALTLARDWQPLGPERVIEAELGLAAPVTIPDASAIVIQRGFVLPDDAPLLRVEHVVLTLDVQHPFRGDLDISLVSPSGVVSRFVASDRRMDGNYSDQPATPEDESLIGANYEKTPFNSVRHWGEPSALPATSTARWTLRVQDRLRSDVGQLVGARLALYGTPILAPALVTAPEDQALATGSTLVLRAAFSGANLNYQWTQNGSPVRGADSAELRVPKFSAKLAGTYVCTATNEAGTATASATVTVDDSPRATFDLRAGATTTLDLGEQVPGDIVLWKAAGLPKGLALDPATGLLAGRPLKPGAYDVIITATTADGVVIRAPLEIDVAPIPDSFTGAYVGLVSRDATLNADLGGALTLNVNSAGVVTGRLVLGRATHAFSGLLNGRSAGDITLDTVLPKPGLRLTLQLAEVDGLATVSGTVTGAVRDEAPPTASISGARSAWHARGRPATDFAGATAAAFVAIGDEAPPLGASVATFTTNSAGRVSWVLTPADGAPALTGSTPLTDDGALLLHAPYRDSRGSLRGILDLPTATEPALGSDSTLDWLRKAAPALAVPDGFGPVELAPVAGGGRYVKPAAGERILERTASDADLVVTVAPTFAQLDAAEPLDAALTLSSSNRFVVAAPNAPKLTLAFASATGRITGGHLDSTARKARVTAVILPHATPARAVGFSFAPAAGVQAAASSALSIASP